MKKVAPVITKIAPVRKLTGALVYWGFGKSEKKINLRVDGDQWCV